MNKAIFVVLAAGLLSSTLFGCSSELPYEPNDGKIYIDSIATNLTSIHDMKVGDSIQFYAYAFPKNAVDTTLVFSSDSSTIVSITQDGLAKAHRPGMAILAISAVKGGFGIGSVMRVSE